MRRFWIDTDTGSDDAVAILMALRYPDVSVAGMSIMAGNVSVELGARNARYTAELCGVDVPVYIGVDRPLLREMVFSWLYHGEGGMSGMTIPEPHQPVQPEHGVTALIEAVRAQPGELTVVAPGPLTNLATALRLAPDIADKIAMCYIMVIAANVIGNTTPAAEFNIWVDPDAAKIVFDSDLPALCHLSP